VNKKTRLERRKSESESKCDSTFESVGMDIKRDVTRKYWVGKKVLRDFLFFQNFKNVIEIS
jgi:hypothetical protein